MLVCSADVVRLFSDILMVDDITQIGEPYDDRSPVRVSSLLHVSVHGFTGVFRQLVVRRTARRYPHICKHHIFVLEVLVFRAR